MNQTNATKQVTANTATDARGRVKMLAFIALMGAVSTVLMLLRFPLPFLPPFMSFDLSGVMEIMAGFLFGPLAALAVIVLKILLQLLIQGSLSFGAGEVQGLLLSCSYVLPAMVVYYFRKSKQSAAIGMALGTVTVAIVAVFTNLYLIIPYYAAMMGTTMEDIVAMCTAVNPAVKSAAGMVIMGIIPFNLIKYGVTSAVTFLVYKRISKVIRRIINN